MRFTTPILLTAVLVPFLLLGCPSHPPVTEPPEEPETESPHFDYRAYSVKKGDTLISIGRHFEVPWQEIQRNNDVSPNDMKIGQILLIPLHARGSEAAEGSTGQEKPAPTTSQPPAPQPPKALHKGDPAAQWWWPTGGNVTRRFGQEVRGFPEPGIGISAPRGTRVHATADGRVLCVIHRASSDQRGWGNVVAIGHPGGMVSWYGRLDEISVKEGATLEQGQPIGTVGASGAGGEAGLALRFFRDERPVDPLKYLP